MVGLSVWVEKDLNVESENFQLIRNILDHNAIMFDTYYIITNKDKNQISKQGNVEIISLEQLKPILKKYLGIEFMPRDHQLSDIGTLLAREIVREVSGKFENTVYVDADFLVTNPLILDELRRKRTHFCLFLDCNYYCTHNTGFSDTYINAALSYVPATPDESDYSKVRMQLIEEMSRRFKEHEDKEYNSVGPQLLYSAKDKLYICQNVKPIDIPYGEFCPTGDGTVETVQIKYDKYALGIHFLLSMSRVNRIKINPNIHVYPRYLSVKVTC